MTCEIIRKVIIVNSTITALPVHKVVNLILSLFLLVTLNLEQMKPFAEILLAIEEVRLLTHFVYYCR